MVDLSIVVLVKWLFSIVFCMFTRPGKTKHISFSEIQTPWGRWSQASRRRNDAAMERMVQFLFADAAMMFVVDVLLLGVWVKPR